MAGINMRTPVRHWLDAAYCMILETNVDDVKQLESALSTRDAQIDPVAVRETWGATPQHQAMMAGLVDTSVPGQ
jgi:hypothetical protein